MVALRFIIAASMCDRHMGEQYDGETAESDNSESEQELVFVFFHVS